MSCNFVKKGVAFLPGTKGLLVRTRSGGFNVMLANSLWFFCILLVVCGCVVFVAIVHSVCMMMDRLLLVLEMFGVTSRYAGGFFFISVFF